MALRNWLIYCVVALFAISNQFADAENEFELEVKFDREFMHIFIGESNEIMLLLKRENISRSELQSNATLRLVSSNPEVVQMSENFIQLTESGDVWNGFPFGFHPVGLGNANISVEICRKNKKEIIDKHVSILVTRNHMIKKFKPQHVLLYLKFMQYFYIVMNVCFGAALDVKKLKAILRNPIGPSFAIISNFIILPLVSVSSAFYIQDFSMKHHLLID